MERPVQLSERARREARCAICRDERGALACHTLFHGECRSELKRCPTLGCGELAPPSSEALAPENERARTPRRLAPELPLGIPTGALLGLASS